MTDSVPTLNYTWQQGEDLVMSFVYNEGPDGAEVPIDLTGYSLRMDVVDNSGTVLYTFNSDDADVATVDEAVLGADGSINITVPRQLTLPPDGVIYSSVGGTPLNYDIFLRRPNNKQFPIARGTITVVKSYTLWL